MSNSYPFGNPVRIEAAFLNETGGEFVPTGDVVFRVKAPDGTVTEYTFGTDEQVVRDTDSTFHMWVRPTDQSGTWKYGAQALDADGNIDCADGDEFEIEEDAFA